MFVTQGIVKDKGDKDVIKMDAYTSTETEYGDKNITIEWHRVPPDKQKELYNKVQVRRGGTPPYSTGDNKTCCLNKIKTNEQTNDTLVSTKDQLGPRNNNICHSINKNTNLHTMTCTMLFQTYVTGSVPVLMHSEMHVNHSVGLQKTINPIQTLTTSEQCSQTLSEVERCEHSTVRGEHLKVNVKNDKMVSKPWAACTTPSQLQETGNLPGSQSSTRLEMRRKPSNGPHTAIPSTLNLTTHGPHSRTCSRLE